MDDAGVSRRTGEHAVSEFVVAVDGHEALRYLSGW
jgi:hypothetical protein